MNELNSAEISLSDQAKFKLNEINKIKDYFNTEMSKKLSKYIAAFNYIDKTLLVLSATSKGISIISFAVVIRIPEGIASASFILIFSLTTEIIKNRLYYSLTTLIDLDINHKEFKTILNEKQKYEQIEECIGNTKSMYKLSENSRDIRENNGNT